MLMTTLRYWWPIRRIEKGTNIILPPISNNCSHCSFFGVVFSRQVGSSFKSLSELAIIEPFGLANSKVWRYTNNKSKIRMSWVKVQSLVKLSQLSWPGIKKTEFKVWNKRKCLKDADSFALRLLHFTFYERDNLVCSKAQTMKQLWTTPVFKHAYCMQHTVCWSVNFYPLTILWPNYVLHQG